MKVSEKIQRYRSMLDEAILSLDKSLTALNHSYQKCSDIINPYLDYSLDEQESFEALASRFARSSDILTQKVLKTLYILLQEDIKTVIDGATFLEKLEIIDFIPMLNQIADAVKTFYCSKFE